MDAAEAHRERKGRTMTNATNVEKTEQDEATTEELAKTHEGRARIYGLLSRMYRVEVDPLFLTQLQAMRFPAASGNDLMDAGYRRLADYLSNVNAGTLTELAVDYARTFIGHGVDSYSAAYPFESVYTSEKRLMMQDARDEVLALYRSEKLDKSGDWKEGEDHVALELEFMKTLAERTAAAIRSGDDAEAHRLVEVQHSFVEDHLRRWMPSLTKDMRRFAQTDFYQGLADLTDGFRHVDAAFLAECAAE